MNSDDVGSDNEDGPANTGWADSVSKILKANKPKGKKTIVLSKAKKLTDVKKKAKPVGFEVQTTEGVIKEEVVEPENEEEEHKEPLRKRVNIVVLLNIYYRIQF